MTMGKEDKMGLYRSFCNFYIILVHVPYRTSACTLHNCYDISPLLFERSDFAILPGWGDNAPVILVFTKRMIRYLLVVPGSGC